MKKKIYKFLITWLSSLFKIIHLDSKGIKYIYYYMNGIGKYENNYVSGESYLLKYLKNRFADDNKFVFFDVGANKGTYSYELTQAFPKAHIYSFEPNLNAYKELITINGINAFCIALGNSNKASHIYTYKNQASSEHASLFSDVISDLHLSNNVMSIPITIKTIDYFCIENNIDKIDFLKIDTEGYEFNVLQGANNMITEGKIEIIQFEFNEMNIIARVFLKDFYDMLSKYYSFYRLDTNRLIDLGAYKSSNEIFHFQNIICIKK